MNDAPLPESEYQDRRTRLAERMAEDGIDLVFVPPSSDLEYLTGLERDLPSFGQSSYAHGWVAGAFIAPGREPLYVLPRMFVAFHLWGREPGDLVTVNETDDGQALFRSALMSLGPARRIGIPARTWGESVLELQTAVPQVEVVNATPLVNELRRVKSTAELELMRKACGIVDAAMTASAPRVQPGVTMAELGEEVEHQLRIRGSRTPSFPTHIFSYGYEQSHDSQDAATGHGPIADGEAVMFDFGGVYGGYCSDFGRTVVCGEPPAEYERVYGIMLDAQEAGRVAAVPGARASEVDAACRAPIEDAGLGEFFRHRMGHGIGLDVHEQPFISTENSTALEPGMTFTDEPSILWDGNFGIRIEDIVVCAEGGGEYLNRLGREPVVNAA
jgi:Xaa-Pro aminopeptidase